MTKRFTWFVMILVGVSLTNLMVRGGVLKAIVGGIDLVREDYPALVGEVMRQVEENYVEEVDSEKMFYGALHGMMLSLNDPHSDFIEPERYKQVKENTSGHFGGLGIVIGIREGYLTVVETLDGKPADKSGVKPGDRILKISGEPTTGIDPMQAIERLRMWDDPVTVRKLLGITLPEAVDKLRGPVGEPVTITIGRENEEPQELTILREEIELKSVSDVKIVDDGIGYIRLSDFQEGNIRDLNSAIEGLRQKGMESLILDLRNNPGGLLDSAIEIADRFIPDGNVIVSTRGRGEEKFSENIARDGFPDRKMPLAVLVNEYSASGSEIVAAALQDLGYAIIVGKRTYGKGSVQSLVPLRGGSALRLTVSRYYSPEGRSIDKVGIPPDIEVDIASEEAKEAGIPEEKGKEKKKDDAQLIQAINALKSIKILKKVY